MGAETSTESGEEFLREFQNKYSFTREINDSRFGDIQIYKENGGEGYVFLKSQWCQSEEDYAQFLKQCNQRINNPHRCVLKMIGFTQSSETQLCGDFSKVTVYYEYFAHNMERELDKRHNKQEFFNEQEIWFLLESIVSSCAFFEQQKIYHGDIRPQNILLTNEGFVKIADHGLVNTDKNSYVKALQYGEQSYLSPLQMQALAGRELHPRHNMFKSDVYSLGMTMLEVCCLYTARSCYEYTTCKILPQVIDDLLNKARGRYSSFLVNIVQELLQEEESNRPNFTELNTLLAPYADSIQNLIPFNPDYSLVKKSVIPGQQLGQSVINQQQPQNLFQSQVAHQQPLQNQSQIIYQQNQQPFIQSPEPLRYQQQYDNPQYNQQQQVVVQNTPQYEQQLQSQYHQQQNPQYIYASQPQQQQHSNNPQVVAYSHNHQPVVLSSSQQQQQPQYIYQQQSSSPPRYENNQLKYSRSLPTQQQQPPQQQQVQRIPPPQQQKQQQQHQVYHSVVNQQQPTHGQYQQADNYYQQPHTVHQVIGGQPGAYQAQQVNNHGVEIDQRIEKAIKNSEETIQKHNNTKFVQQYQQQPQQYQQQQYY